MSLINKLVHLALLMNITTLFNITNNITKVNATYFHEPASVIVASDPVVVTLLNAAVLAYQLIHTDANITVLSTSSDTAKLQLEENTVDLAFYVGGLSATDITTYPDVFGEPLLASGVAPVYNLPDAPGM